MASPCFPNQCCRGGIPCFEIHKRVDCARPCVSSDKHIWYRAVTGTEVTITKAGCTRWGGTTMPCHPTLLTFLHVFVLLSPLNGCSVEGTPTSALQRQGWGDPPLPPVTMGNTTLTPSRPPPPRHRHLHTPSACDLRHCQRLFANYKLPANPTRRRRRYTSCGGDSAQSTNNSPRGMRRSPPWPTTERSPLRFIVRCSFLSQGTRRGSGYGDCYACMEARGCRFGQKCQDNSRLRIFFLFHRLHLRCLLYTSPSPRD